MADAHWAASARMPSDLLLSEAVQLAQQACSLQHQPQAAHWVLVLEHLRQCCQAYRYDVSMVVLIVPDCNLARASQDMTPVWMLSFVAKCDLPRANQDKLTVWGQLGEQGLQNAMYGVFFSIDQAWFASCGCCMLNFGSLDLRCTCAYDKGLARAVWAGPQSCSFLDLCAH